MEVNVELEDIASKVDHWQKFNRYLILEAIEIVKRSQKKEALELGCGSGVTTGVYLKYFERVTIVDGSSIYLKRTEEKNNNFNNAKYICSYFEDLKLDKEFPDVIMAHILEHVEDPIDILRRAKKWVTNNGRIHIIVPNGYSLHRMIGAELGMLKMPDELFHEEAARGHRRVYNLNKLEDDIKKAGLKVIEKRGCLVKTFPDAVLKIIHQEYIDALFSISKNVNPEICADLYIICEK